MNRKLVGTLVLLLAAVAAYLGDPGPLPTPGAESPRVGEQAPEAADNGTRAIADAFRQQRSGVQVRGRGIVERILRDDLDGSRHQRFVLRLASGQTLLVAHNIDLAPRIDDLRAGDEVAFHGEYEWNRRGGIVHWTHRDPAGRHANGWLEHRGRRYQ